jgi:CheY-like chemotaxis protein
MSAPDAQSQLAASSPLPSAVRWHRILVVDDNPMDVRVCRQILTQWSRIVDVAQDGLKAVSMMAESLKQGPAFDVVLLDYHMPGMNGPSTARLLRASGYRGPMIAISANECENSRGIAHKAGCKAFVTKPIHWKSLITVMLALTQPAPD